MSELTAVQLEALGISKEDLIERVVERIAASALSRNSLDEDGDEVISPSTLKQALDVKIRDAVSEKIDALASAHVLPNVNKYIEELTLCETNKWGQKTGTPVTFIEYLVQRAEAYLREDVNYEGKSRAETSSSYSWSKSQTRITHMVNAHLHYSIESAMKTAVSAANSAIVNGINDTVKIKLSELAANLKMSVTPK